MCRGDHRIKLTMRQVFQYDESLGETATLRARIICHRWVETGFMIPTDESRIGVRVLLQDAG